MDSNEEAPPLEDVADATDTNTYPISDFLSFNSAGHIILGGTEWLAPSAEEEFPCILCRGLLRCHDPELPHAWETRVRACMETSSRIKS